MKDKTETRKIEVDSQSCQTETPIDFKKDYNRRRDVQLQTLTRTQLDQIDSQVINPGPQTSRCHQISSQNNADDSNPSTSSTSGTTTATTSEESLDNSLETFGTGNVVSRQVDTSTMVTLIDLNDDSNYCGPSGSARTTDNSPQIMLDNHREVIVDDCQQFNSFVSDNAGEEPIDDHLSVAPPSYEDVIDYRERLSDDQPIIVDYGTL